MHNLIKFFSIVFLGLVFVITISCVSESCLEETMSSLKATFYKKETNKPMAPDSITVFGLAKEDNKVYNKAPKVQTIQLPLNPSADTCRFVIEINGVTDTLSFFYSSYPHIISKECGYTFYHFLDSVDWTKTAIDTVRIRNRYITTINDENIRILLF